MIVFEAFICKYTQNADKTGWTYVEVPKSLAHQIKADHKKSFRVKGFIDHLRISGLALIPAGEGDFILPLNADIRKAIRKSEGALLNLSLESDEEFKIECPAELEELLADDPEAQTYLHSLARSHREYFYKWINSAKTEYTRTDRIVKTINALSQQWDYGKMIRSSRKEK